MNKKILGRLWSPFFIFTLVIFLSPCSWAANNFFSQIELQGYSAPISIDSAASDWSGDYYGGDRQWLTSWAEFGYQLNEKWQLSLLQRSDFDLRFHPETAELYYRIQNHLPLPTGKDYQLSIQAQHFTGSGARLEWSFKPHSTLTTRWGVSLLNTYQITEGSITGNASATAANAYNYNIEIDYVYDQETLFDRQLEDRPKGTAISLDTFFEYQVANSKIELRITDLLSRVTWKNLPYTQASGTSNQQGFDSDGYIVVNPAINGKEGYYQTYYQTLQPRTWLQYSYLFPSSSYTAQMSYKNVYDHNLYGAGAMTSYGGHLIGATLWPQLKALTLSYQQQRFSIDLTMDQLDTLQTRTFWLSLRYN